MVVQKQARPGASCAFTDEARARKGGGRSAAGGHLGATGWREPRLEQAVAELFKKGIAPTTERSYRTKSSSYCN